MNIDKTLQLILNTAYSEAVNRRNEYLTSEHILYSSLFFDPSVQLFKYCGADIEELKNDLEEYISQSVPVIEQNLEPNPLQSAALESIIENAFMHVQSSQKPTLDFTDFLAAMFDDEELFSVYFLKKQGITKLDILEAGSHGILDEDDIFDDNTDDIGDETSEIPGLSKQEATLIKKHTINLTQKAAKDEIDPLIGREDIIERTIQVLCRRVKNNPIHIGDPGVGKTAITEGLARLIYEDKVPRQIKDAQIYSLDMASLVAGTKFRGDFEKKLKSIISALMKMENIIIFIDEIHTMVGAGSTSSSNLDVSNILKPILSEGKLRFIGATTYEEYKKNFAHEGALSRRFQKIDISEPSVDDCYKILIGLKDRYEEHHNVVYTKTALKAAVELTSKYMSDRFLPDKAIDVIDEAGAYAQIHSPAGKTVKIYVRDIEKIISKITKIPESNISTSESHKLKQLRTQLKDCIFGQDEAIEKVVASILHSRAGFNSENKPVASFLFVGPTGVGKTELSKQISKVLGIHLHRFDMSEYQEQHTISRLIGAPPGYVGHHSGGQLTEAIRKHPHSVLLLDEIEKAHPDIFNSFLQIMDYATLTDNTGLKTDFRNVIIIMTSNAGARDINKLKVGFASETHFDSIKQAVDRVFSPEFRNRLDAIVTFNHLNQELIMKIVEKELKLFSGKLSKRKIKLIVSEDAKKYICKKGFSNEFGAREVERIIQQKIKKPLAEEVIFGAVSSGGTIVVGFDEETQEITFADESGELINSAEEV